MDFPPINRDMNLKQFNLNEYCLCLSDDIEEPMTNNDYDAMAEDYDMLHDADDIAAQTVRRMTIESDSYNPVRPD
jgi:hypothetical protein